MAKLKESIKSLGYAVNGVLPTGKNVTELLASFGASFTSATISSKRLTDIINEIANKKSTLALTITPYTGDEDLWGKKASDLQENIAITNNVVSGTCYYVEGYDPELNHFLVLKAVSNDANAKITAQIIGGQSGPIELDPDGICLFKIASIEQSLQYVVSINGISKTYNLSLANLTLADKD